jgi:hypothetical protein
MFFRETGIKTASFFDGRLPFSRLAGCEENLFCNEWEAESLHIKENVLIFAPD